MQTARYGQGVQLGQEHGVTRGVETAAQAIHDDLGLLEDLLEHEVAVAALLGRLHVPLDGLGLMLHGGKVGQAQDLILGIGGVHDLAVFQKDHRARVGQKGRDVRSHEVLARADAEDERGGHARGPDLTGIFPAHETDGVGAVGPAQGRGKSLEQVGFLLVAVGDEVDQHFRVGLGMEDIALLQQLFLQFLIVLDDAVMHDGQAAVVGSMGMGIALGGHAVRGPAGMAHGAGGHGNRLLDQLFLKGGKLALGTGDAQLAALHAGNARGIIAAVFKTPQAFDDHRHRRTVPGISDNATHGDLLCDKGWRRGELFLRGEGNLFLAEKRFPSPLKLPPSFQKPLICCFAPQGNPCSGTYGARKNQGKMPQGTAILSVKSRPGKCPSGGDAGRAETRPCIHEKRKRGPPGMAARQRLFCLSVPAS